MAYVLWRVFTKKYAKVRLGIASLPVIPAERRVQASGKENETWTLAPSTSSDQSNLNSTIKSTIADGSKVRDESLNTTELMKSSDNNIDDNINDEPVVLDDQLVVESVEINRDNENRKSRAKKVKNYLRKCKGALSSSSSSSALRDDSLQSRQSGHSNGGKRTTSNNGGGRRSNRRPASSSWYLDDGTALNNTNDIGAVIPITNVTAAAVKDINERMSDDVLPVRTTSLTRDYDYKATPPTSTRRFGSESLLDSPDRYVDNDTLDLKLNHDIDIDACEKMKNIIQIKNDDEEVLMNDDDDDDKNKLSTGHHLLSGGRGDVASLVRNLLGPIYGENVLDLLTRQARDILVCAYHGNLEMFVELYLSPASKLLAKVKHLVSETVDECVVPNGWPLTLGDTGLVLQLGELETSALRHGECYLCVRNSRQSGGDDATTTNTTTTTTTTTTTSVIINNESTTENSKRQLERIIDIVEIALVWRSSMRVPGILRWEREDDFMDWRELKEQNQTNSTSVTNTSTRRRRRKSRDELSTSAATRIQDTSPSAAIAAASSSSSSSNQRLRTNVISPIRINTTANDVCINNPDNEHVILPVTMRFDQRQTNRHHQKDVATRLNIDDLKNPSCLLSIINNQLNNETSSSSLSSSSIIDLPDELNHDELANLISTLLVTVERKIERVNLDDLIFPCPGCRNIDTDNSLLGCTCALPSESDGLINNKHNSGICDCGMNSKNSKSFEIDGIKHIDSDDEEEVRMDFGVKRKDNEISSPRSVHDFSDEVINCGLRLPGYADDATGRLVLEFENLSSTIERKNCPREIASYLLYLTRLHSSDRTKNGWTLLICGANNDDFETLDRALVLVQDRVNVRQALALRNTECSLESSMLDSQLPRSRVKIMSIDDVTLNQRIPERKNMNYDHQRWIEFYKEYDTLMCEWQSYGRQLVLELSELKDCTNITNSLTPLTRLLTDASTSIKAMKDVSVSLTSLEESAATLLHIDYIVNALKRAKHLIEEIKNAARRLENSFELRRVAIKNFSIVRNIEEQAREVLAWLCKKGEDNLAKHTRHAATTTLTVARLHERDFEKFYFSSMRHLDKGSDLADAATTSGLNELSHSLREHLRDFGARLENRREYLEDTTRCCLLQDRANEWMRLTRLAMENDTARGDDADDNDGGGDDNEADVAQRFGERHLTPLPSKQLEEMMSLAEKLGNETLIEQCRIVRDDCIELSELIRNNLRLMSSGTINRGSFGISETAGESNLWEDSDSNGGSGPLDSGISSGITSGGAGNGSNSSSSNGGCCRSTLDNIAELRENGDQDNLDSPPRTPSRSPAGRRLAKPPVNSHLQRSPSIAPAGMKAKKTILLIMREMIQTERDYVQSLEYIIENYIPELVRDDIPQALRGQRNVIFGNVEKIYEFHSQHFLRELEQCEHSPMMVGQCFLRHENKFYLYALYNKNKPNSDSLMAEYGTTFFKTKQLELGDKMDLASYLLKPVQRMGKYALLLQQLVKAGTDLSDQLAGKNDDNKETKEMVDVEDDVDSVKPIVEGEADLRAAEQMVRFQLRHGNDLLAMDSLRDCDVNVKEQGRLLRQNEFLVWQGKGKKCLRQVFLFEDLILFSKARRFPDRKNLDIYIYKHSIKTTDIGMTAVMADSPTKFEIWFRKRKPGDTYTLQCASEDIKKAWTEELSNLLWKQALRNREVRLAEMSSMGIGNKPCLDIRPSADQINDRSISVAQLSKTPRFRNSIAVSIFDDSNRCSRRPHSVISVSSSSSSGGSSGGPQTALHLGLEASPRLHHRSTTLNSQCSVESGIIADISIVSDDGVDNNERNHWKSTLESPTSSHPPSTSTPMQSPTSSHTPTIPSASTSSSSSSSTDVHLTSPYDQDLSINL